MFFKWFGIHICFVLDEPEQSCNKPAYKAVVNIVAHINVVNYIVEKDVKLIKEYNSIKVKDKKQKQY